jgi:hypothetical protein
MTTAALLAAGACQLFAAGPAQEHPIKLPDGQTAVARNPYGATLARNRLFFDFSLRGDVQKAEWALDGKVVRTDDKAPFEWKGLSGSDKRMPAGDHTITVTAFTAAGQASTQFKLTATDCQPAGMSAYLPRRPGPVRLGATVQAEQGPAAPSLDGVIFTAVHNVVATGRVRGTLEVVSKKGAVRRYRFDRRLRRGALRVTANPGRRRFLAIAGLPAGTRAVNVRIDGRSVRLRNAAKRWDVAAALTAGGDSAVVTEGGLYV